MRAKPWREHSSGFSVTRRTLFPNTTRPVWVGLSNLAAAILSIPAIAQTGDRFVPVPSFEPEPRPAECSVVAAELSRDLSAVFTAMASGPGQAAACVAALETSLPGWEQADGAERLIGPFIDHLLGDGTARGLQRHQVFIDLLGHLENIEPGWRFHPAAKARMPEIILASTVEDPFVAHFWSTTLQEMDPDWRETDTARMLISAIYERALQEETRSAGPRNQRPAALLKTLSWPRYAWLKVYAGALASWPKRIVSTVVVVLLLIVTFRALRRRKTP